MTITINEKSYNIPFPIGVTLTHEGGLDQANITIKHISQKDPFEPNTRVKFLDQWWAIGNDQVVDEIYAGKYTHTIMLVEVTKELERVVCGAKTYTRPLKTNYTPVSVTPTYLKTMWTSTAPNKTTVEVDEGEALGRPKNKLKSPISATSLTIQSADSIEWEASILENKDKQASYSFDGDEFTTVTGTETIDISGRPTVWVRYSTTQEATNQGVQLYLRYDTTFRIVNLPTATKNHMKVFDVVSDFLATAEPIRTDMESRYRHVTSVDGCIDTALTECPEISCANCSTLKEQLDQFAKILHAKLKMDINIDGIGLIYFVPLTSLEKATINGTRISAQYNFSSEKFAGRIQTNAANLVISNKGEGTMTEPFGDSSNLIQKTLRCADGNARIGDETGEIETALPIRRVNKLIITKPIGGETLDLTQYVNEEAVYLGLSSFEGEQSRCFSLYYTQGQANIKGLFVKEANAISDALSDYTIENIWKEAGGTSTWDASEYKDALVYVEYEPFLNIRLVNSRVDGKGGLATYVANQAANEMDRDALGDFMRGTAEQMASADKTRTYLFKSLADLPKVGTMYDDNNVISAISFEVYPYFVKATLNISEHYNKFGQYVEVPSAVRQYEVDVKNVRDRSVLYTDVCTISFTPSSETDNSLLTRTAKDLIVGVAGNDNISEAALRASAADVETYAEVDGVRTLLQSLSMPVNSFAFGNSIAFIIPFKDNFSAGPYAAVAKSTYNAQNYAQYVDVYGDVDLASIKVYDDFSARSSTNRVSVGRRIPLSVGETVSKGTLLIDTASGSESLDPALLVLKKDSRERIIFTYQLLFQGNDGIIIGQDLAKMSPLVKSYKGMTVDDAQVYLFGDGDDTPYLDPILGSTKEKSSYEYEVEMSENVVSIANGRTLPSHSAWAIFRGNRFIMGANTPLPLAGSRKLYFNFKHM